MERKPDSAGAAGRNEAVQEHETAVRRRLQFLARLRALFEKVMQHPAGGTGDTRRHHWNFHGFANWGVVATLGLCVLSLVLYFVGNVPELEFPDSVVFWVLRLQRYIFLMLCVFSIGAMGFSVHRLVDNPRFSNVLQLVFFFFTAILGAFLAVLNSFLMATTGGNG